METIKEKIQADLKQALLSGDKTKATILRGLKNVILNAEIAEGKREEGLNDEQVVSLLRKEVKSREESADLYVRGGSQDRADKELAEKKIIEAYLPAQMADEDLEKIINGIVSEFESPSMQQMGQIIARVKQKVGSSADGGRIAGLVKAKLS